MCYRTNRIGMMNKFNEHIYTPSNPYSLTFIANALGGEVLREGKFSNLGYFRSPNNNLLVPYSDIKFQKHYSENIENFSCILTTEKIAHQVDSMHGIMIVKNPIEYMFRLHLFLIEEGWYEYNIKNLISNSSEISPYCFISDYGVIIEDNVVVEPNVTIHKNVFIGAGSIIRSGSVIGGEGFEFRQLNGKHRRVPHMGGVWIGRDVEIQSNSAISRAIYGGCTFLGNGVKLDNLVHIAHGARVGSGTLIAACAEVSGSTVIGENCWVGPNATISNALRIGDMAKILIGAVCIRDVPASARLGGPYSKLVMR